MNFGVAVVVEEEDSFVEDRWRRVQAGNDRSLVAFFVWVLL